MQVGYGTFKTADSVIAQSFWQPGIFSLPLTEKTNRFISIENCCADFLTKLFLILTNFTW